MGEEETLGLWLAHRVFITTKMETVKALRESAAIYEFSIIDASEADLDAAASLKESGGLSLHQPLNRSWGLVECGGNLTDALACVP